MEFRLDEDTFVKYVKEGKELTSETASFHRNEDVAGILNAHTSFFKSSGLLNKVKKSVWITSAFMKTVLSVYTFFSLLSIYL